MQKKGCMIWGKKLESYFESIGEKKFKATQVFEWLYIHKIWDITKFSNIKKEIQEKLMNDFSTDFIKIEIVEIKEIDEDE